MAARTKLAKSHAILTEVVGGKTRIQLVTPLERIERGAIFEVMGEGGTYRTGWYIDREGDEIRECSCTHGNIHVRRPTCSHFLAVEIVMNALGCPKGARR